MKKKLILLLVAIFTICYLVACGNKESTSENVVDAADIGIPDNEMTNKWIPAAGENGLYLDLIANIDADNVKDILKYADVAEEDGYNPYILLGTMTDENDTFYYAYLASKDNENIIITVAVSSNNETTVEEFEGTRDDIICNTETDENISKNKAIDTNNKSVEKAEKVE